MREGGEWTKFQHESDVECLAIDVDRRSASSSQTMLVTSHRAGYSINYKQLSRFIDTWKTPARIVYKVRVAWSQVSLPGKPLN